MILSRDYSNRACEGERRATGCIRKVNLSVGNQAERFDPAGSESPKG